jgi:hypothetical protein
MTQIYTIGTLFAAFFTGTGWAKFWATFPQNHLVTLVRAEVASPP